MKGKRGDHKTVVNTMIIVFCISIAIVLMIIIKRNSGLDPMMIKFFAIDGAYMINALVSSPSPVLVNYSFGIDKYDVFVEGNVFNIKEKNPGHSILEPLNSKKTFALDLNVPVIISLLGEESFYQKAEVIRLTKEKKPINGFVCPSVNTSIYNPVVLLDPEFLDHVDFDGFVFDFLNSIDSFSASIYGDIYKTRARNSEKIPLDDRLLLAESSDLVIGAKLVPDVRDFIAVYTNGKGKDAKTACWILNKIEGDSVGIYNHDLFVGEGIHILVEFHFIDFDDLKANLRFYQRALSSSLEEVFGGDV